MVVKKLKASAEELKAVHEGVKLLEELAMVEKDNIMAKFMDICFYPTTSTYETIGRWWCSSSP